MPDYYEFEVVHTEIEPRIWRRFLLPVTGTTFLDLHWAIQDAGPWRDYHLWRFDTPGRGGAFLATAPGSGDPMFPGEEAIPEADRVPLNGYFKRGGSTGCEYCYDFGDDWRLTVEMRGRRRIAEKFYRRLEDGQRAYPIEDSGGLPGYEDCQACLDPKVMNDPKLSEDDRAYLNERLEWIGKTGWSADVFDLQTAKRYFDLTTIRNAKRPYHRLDDGTTVYAPGG